MDIKEFLKVNGFSSLELFFEGSGDSGGIERITAYDENGSETDLLGDKAIESALSEKFYLLINEHFRGVEIDDGGTVSLTLSLEADAIVAKLSGEYYAIGEEQQENTQIDDSYSKPFIDMIKKGLKVNGINPNNCSIAELEFYGSDDSGDVEENIVVHIGNDECFYFELDNKMKDIFYKILSDNLSGFEIDHGTKGSIYFNIETGASYINSFHLFDSNTTEPDIDVSSSFNTSADSISFK